MAATHWQKNRHNNINSGCHLPREEEGMVVAVTVAGDHEMENGVAGGAVRHAAANNVLEVKRGGGERRYSRDGGAEKQQSKSIQ